MGGCEGNEPEYQFSGLKERPWLVRAMRLISASAHAARPGEKSEIGCKKSQGSHSTLPMTRGNTASRVVGIHHNGMVGGVALLIRMREIELTFVRIVSMDRASIPGEHTSPCRTCPFRSVNGSAGLYPFKSPSPVLSLCYIFPSPPLCSAAFTLPPTPCSIRSPSLIIRTRRLQLRFNPPHLGNLEPRIRALSDNVAPVANLLPPWGRFHTLGPRRVPISNNHSAR